MPVATTYLKLLLILAGVVFFYFNGTSEWLLRRGVPIALGLALAIMGLARTWSRLRRWIPNASYFWLLPLFVISLWGRLQLEPAVPEPPEIWYSLSRPKPVYDDSLLASAVVRRWIGPRTYLVDLSLRATQKKIKVYRKRRTQKFRRKQDGGERHTRGKKKRYYDKKYKRYDKRYRNRNNYRYQKRDKKRRKPRYKNKRRSQKKRTYKKRKRRRYYRKRWGPERPVTDDQAASFPVLVRVNEEGWYPGCKIQLRIFGRGVPRRFAGEARDAGFAAYVRRKGAAGYIRLSRKYHVLAAGCQSPPFRFRARRMLDGVLSRAGLTGVEFGVARGLLLGRSGFLFGRTKRAARELGILHLFAASGLHLGIFFACLALPLGRLKGRRHWLALCAPLPFCLGYLWLLDFPVSLTRAFVFVSLYALQSVVPVYMPAAERLANTALAALLIAPREMCSLSGALSFGAVSGILFFFPVLQERILRPRRRLTTWLYTQFAVSMTASLGTTPVLLATFGAYSYGSPLANLIMVPLVGLLLPLLYLLVGLDLAGAPGIVLLGLRWSVERGLSGFSWLTANLGGFALYRRYDSLAAPPALYCLLLLAALAGTIMIQRRSAPSKGPLRFLRGLALLALLLLGPLGFFLEAAVDWEETLGFFLLAK